jgi:hypothetical protein
MLDVDDLRRFELHRLEVFPVEDDVLVLCDLEALHEVGTRDFVAGTGVDGLHANAIVGRRIDEVEAYRLGLAYGRIERDRAGDERQAQVPLP